MSALKGMCLTAGNSAVRVSSFLSKGYIGSISSEWAVTTAMRGPLRKSFLWTRLQTFSTDFPSVSRKTLLLSLTMQAFTVEHSSLNSSQSGRNADYSFSFCRHTAHISTSLKRCGAYSKVNGSGRWTMSSQTPCSMLRTDHWRQSGVNSLSILPACLSMIKFLRITYQ